MAAETEVSAIMILDTFHLIFHQTREQETERLSLMDQTIPGVTRLYLNNINLRLILCYCNKFCNNNNSSNIRNNSLSNL